MRESMGKEGMSEHQLEGDISSKNKLNVRIEITRYKVWEETKLRWEFIFNYH